MAREREGWQRDARILLRIFRARVYVKEPCPMKAGRDESNQNRVGVDVVEEMSGTNLCRPRAVRYGAVRCRALAGRKSKKTTAARGTTCSATTLERRYKYLILIYKTNHCRRKETLTFQTQENMRKSNLKRTTVRKKPYNTLRSTYVQKPA